MGLIEKILSSLSEDIEPEKESGSKNTGSDPFSPPESVVKDKVKVSRRTEIISTHYDEITAREAKQIAQILESHLTDTDGYSQRDIRQEVENELDISADLAERIVWTERASIEISDTVRTYKRQMAERESEWVFSLPGSNDDRTHPIIAEARDEINQQEGVTIDELQELLTEKAKKYQDEGGTPERMDHWVPHEKSRYTITRKVTPP